MEQNHQLILWRARASQYGRRDRGQRTGTASLEFLALSDPPTSASQSAGIGAIIPCFNISIINKRFYLILFILSPGNSMRFHHVGQAGLKLLTSGDPPTSASQSVGITGVSHCTRISLCCSGCSAVARLQLTAASTSWAQVFSHISLLRSWDRVLLLLPRQKYSGMILASCNLRLPGSKIGFHHVGQASRKLMTSGDLPASASQSVGITGVSHRAWPGMISLVPSLLPACHSPDFLEYHCTWQLKNKDFY
ncbi:hypothetical protein AAY473_038430 [Plecturocebus cupreus]